MANSFVELMVKAGVLREELTYKEEEHIHDLGVFHYQSRNMVRVNAGTLMKANSLVQGKLDYNGGKAVKVTISEDGHVLLHTVSRKLTDIDYVWTWMD